MGALREGRFNTLKYGKNNLNIPDIFFPSVIITPPEVPELEDLETEVRKALENPVGAPSLREFLDKDDIVTIVVSDITRPVPTKRILPAIIEYASHAAQIRILVALGLHRKLQRDEIKQTLGEKTASSLPVFQHDANAGARLIFLGRTRYGTEVHFSRFLMPENIYRDREDRTGSQNVKVVLTGTIAPHYFFGFSGGRKSLLPGCASHFSICQNHSLVLGPDGERVPECRAGNLASNPCHLDALDAAGLIDNVFVINTVHAGKTQAAMVTAGDLNEAHISGCRFYLDNCSVESKDKYDIVLASCGGYPRDINFIQSHKSLEYAFRAVKPGGVLVLAAECPEGFGSKDFFHWFRFSELGEFYRELNANYQVYGQTAYSTLWKAKKVDIILLSSLKPDNVARMSMKPVSSLDEAAEIVRARYGEDFSSCIMPYGGDTLIKDESCLLVD